LPIGYVVMVIIALSSEYNVKDAVVSICSKYKYVFRPIGFDVGSLCYEDIQRAFAVSSPIKCLV
jgi:hypothetical protein